MYLRCVKQIAVIFMVVSFVCCSKAQEKSPLPDKPYSSEEFNNYWYSGQAELTSFELQQARYGEIHRGSAVLIFVTEDFLPRQQIKHEHGPRPDDAISVLKLNFTRNFLTGIYPYSMMNSVFTPVEQYDQTLKLSSSSQEWCGQAYLQVNRRGGHYKGTLHSYFQAEGDQSFDIPAALLEDEIWTRIRLNPESLPIGEIELVPGSQYLRFRHQQFEPRSAVASRDTLRNPALSAAPLVRYSIVYQDIPRSLSIQFEATFPYQIVYWEEEMLSGFAAPKRLKTTATRMKTIQLDYWSKNAVADSTYRDVLGF